MELTDCGLDWLSSTNCTVYTFWLLNGRVTVEQIQNSVIKFLEKCQKSDMLRLNGYFTCIINTFKMLLLWNGHL